MADHLRECNSGDLKTDAKTFQQTWCARCSQPDCDLAKFAKTDLMAIRNATWRERYFGTNRADLGIPKFARINKLDFPNLLNKAIKLEISERRGDWSVPDVPVLDGVLRQAGHDQGDAVNEAVRRLSKRGRLDEETDPDEAAPTESEGEDHVPEEPEPPLPENPSEKPAVTEADPPQQTELPSSQKPVRPVKGNVEDRGEVMLGGAPAAVERGKPAAEADPWAAPARPKTTVVKAGAKIQFGKGGTMKVDE